jgi:hypothetical protein
MLSSSLSYEVSITESPMPNSVACQVIDLQLNLPAVVDAPVAVAPDVVVGSSTPPPSMVALCLQTTGVGESFKVDLPNPAALDGCLKGAACQHAYLAMKCHGGTLELLGPRRCLPSKVVSRRCMPCPRSCSLHFLHGGASSGLHFIAVAPPCRSGMSHEFLRSAWRKDVEAPSGYVGCRE